MSELEQHKTLIKEITDRANDKYYDTKLIANAVYWILEQMADRKTEPQTNGYQTFNGTSVYVSRLEDEPQTDNGIGCSRCEGRYDCYDRDMPHAVRCNNYGKITDEPQTERSE